MSLLTYKIVAWDVTANFSFGRHYGFIDQEKDVDNLITDSTDGLIYFAPVRRPNLPFLQLEQISANPTNTGLPNPLDRQLARQEPNQANWT